METLELILAVLELVGFLLFVAICITAWLIMKAEDVVEKWKKEIQ